MTLKGAAPFPQSKLICSVDAFDRRTDSRREKEIALSSFNLAMRIAHFHPEMMTCEPHIVEKPNRGRHADII